MPDKSAARILSQIRAWVIFFMIALALSGITAFPLQSELDWLLQHDAWLLAYLQAWVTKVQDGISHTLASYPFILYGTDWLAFAHIMIALLFIGVLKDPVRNKWIIDWAMLCCIAVFPLAFMTGPIRHIPFFHQVIDCCFGLFGLIPLWVVRRKIGTLVALSK